MLLKRQVVITRKTDHEVHGHGLEALEPLIDDHTLHIAKGCRHNIGRVLQMARQLLLAGGPKGRHHAAESLGPVAGTKNFACVGNAFNEKLFGGHNNNPADVLGRCP